MKIKVDEGENEEVKLWQLLKLSATKLGKKLGIQDYVFIDVDIASILIDLEHAIRRFGTKEEVKAFEEFKKRLIRKLSLKELKKTKEATKLWIASGDVEKRKKKKEEEEEYD